MVDLASLCMKRPANWSRMRIVAVRVCACSVRPPAKSLEIWQNLKMRFLGPKWQSGRPLRFQLRLGGAPVPQVSDHPV